MTDEAPLHAQDMRFDPSLWGLSRDQAESQRIASDPAQPLEDRLDAYLDIMESEVGDTDLLRARNMERKADLRQIWLKFEGGNPSGTQKDRIAYAQVLDSMRRTFPVITVASCGNYGAAMAMAASLAGQQCEVVIPETFHTKRIKEMATFGARIIRVAGDYEDAVAESMERARKYEFYDANPGGANLLIQLRAYAEIAYEIYDELRDAPATVSCPVSNGTTLSGIHKGFQSLLKRGKTSRMPRFIAGSAWRMNPIVPSWRKGLDVCVDLPRDVIHESVVNEPLINWHAIDGDYALHAIRSTEGWAGDAGDRALRDYAKMIREQQGLNVLPCSTAGLAALLQHHAKDPIAPDRHVVILTGRDT